MTDSVDPSSGALTPLQPLSRADLMRMHRGQLDPELAAAWIPRADGLTAPRPSEEGELVPNGTGYVIAAGAMLERILPRSKRLLPFLYGGIGVTASNLASLWDGGAVQVGLFTAAALALVVQGQAFLTAWTWRRQFSRAQQTRAPGQLPPGTVARIVGVIPPQPTVPALFSAAPAVLFRNRIGQADETRGIDFDLQPETGGTGDRVRVSVRDAFLLDEPRRQRSPSACGPVSNQPGSWGHPARLRSDLMIMPRTWYRLFSPRLEESLIAPGDRIEVCGVIHHEAAPDGHAAPGRGVPLRAGLRAEPGSRLLVRKL